jgi:hypothetical protein
MEKDDDEDVGDDNDEKSGKTIYMRADNKEKAIIFHSIMAFILYTYKPHL